MLALALVAVHVALAWLARPPGVLVAQDDATYILLGRSLRSLGYHELFHAGLPPHGMYPPVFPALLAGASTLLGERWDVLTALTTLASAGTLLLLFDAVRRLWSPAAALLCLVGLVANPALVSRAGTVRAEPLYALFTVLVLWLLSREQVRRGEALPAGVIALLAVFTRSIGVTLVAALGIHWLLERRWRAASLLGLATLLCVGSWIAWGAHVSRMRPWAPSYVEDALRVRQDIRRDRDVVIEEPSPSEGRGGETGALAYVREMGYRIFVATPRVYLVRSLPQMLPLPTVQGTVADNLAGGVVMVSGLIAGLVTLLRRWRMAGLYLASYGLLLTLWSWKSARFLEPLLFLLVPTLLLGLYVLLGRWRPRFGYAAMGAMALVLATTGAARSADFIGAHVECPGLEESLADRNPCVPPDVAGFFEIVGLVESHVPDSALFLTSKPEALYLYAGNRSISYNEAVASEDPATFMGFLREEGVDYVILASMLPGDVGLMSPYLHARCDELRLVGAAEPRVYLFALRSAGAAPERGRACAAVEQFIEANRNRDFGLGYPDRVTGVPPLVRPVHSLRTSDSRDGSAEDAAKRGSGHDG